MPKADDQYRDPSSGTAAALARERGEETRWALVQAAVDVIAADGWEGLTTRAVARRAEVNAALVHYHFGSVAALARQAAGYAVAAVMRRVLDRVAEAGDIGGAVEAALAEGDAGGVEHAEGLLVAQAAVQGTRDPALAEQLREGFAALRALLAERIALAGAEGRLATPVDPQATAALLAALIDGLRLHALAGDGASLVGVGDALRAMLGEERTGRAR